MNTDRKPERNENLEWYSKSELFQLYSSAMLSDNLQGSISFDEFLERARPAEKFSLMKDVK